LYSKTIGKPGVVAQTCNPSTREAKAGGLILKARGGERRERRRGREREREKERERERERERKRKQEETLWQLICPRCFGFLIWKKRLLQGF
jgi:hypothetical protein